MGGITKRWFLNTICVILAFLSIIVAVFLVAIHNYYYEAASVTIESRAQSSSVMTFFSDYLDVSDRAFEAGALEFLNLFAENDILEIWVIDKYGKVLFSSTGFPVDKDTVVAEYKEALESEEKNASWVGKNSNGEKVLAMTVMLPVTESNNGALRYMVSLDAVDTQFRNICFLVLMLCFLAVGLVCFSGMFLIQSIVKPVKKINESARLIAKGDYNAALPPHKYNDEIGELCKSFNAMAKAMVSTEKIKNDFISTVSHELRTPLTAIKGWGETILEEDGSESTMTRKGIEVIISEAERLDRIVEDLLDFSKMESGRLSLKLEMIDGLAELDEAVFVFRDRAAREGIDITYNAPDAPAPMNADSDRIKQVFVNVLDNALKYTPQGGKIDVLATVQENLLTVKISDTGCGIPPEALRHVKEKFFKANVSVRGSGIGLAVSDEIIKMLNGSLNISSIVDVGTTVEIILPLATRENQN